MNAATSTVGYGRLIFNALITLVAVVALYWLYQYLYAPSDSGNRKVLVSGKQKANVVLKGSDNKPLNPIPSSAFPPITEGGEFSVEFWLYISNWSVKNGQNKHIFSLGGDNFDTIRVYLAPFKSDLRVRLHTNNSAATMLNPEEQRFSDSLPATDRNKTFNENSVTFDTNIANNEPICDVTDLDLQRWIHVVVTVSNRTVDTYMDGKLARSCILPNSYKVDGLNYTANVCNYGGFGGYISNVTVYDMSLSPDIVYNNYMNGPGAATNTLWEWVQSFFSPSLSDVNV